MPHGLMRRQGKEEPRKRADAIDLLSDLIGELKHAEIRIARLERSNRHQIAETRRSVAETLDFLRRMRGLPKRP